ncbi:MAG: cell division protein ZapA [Flammeovirgaceae bacterium]|nr:cell division protein ZapA [Flammeovirgaceae bacterium]
MENLSIKLVIGNRSYPMKVPIEDEQKIRNIGKDLNKRISEIKSQMNIDDLQDILAMIAFKLSVELDDNKDQTSENKDAYKKIENMINEIDKKLE